MSGPGIRGVQQYDAVKSGEHNRYHSRRNTARERSVEKDRHNNLSTGGRSMAFNVEKDNNKIERHREHTVERRSAKELDLNQEAGRKKEKDIEHSLRSERKETESTERRRKYEYEERGRSSSYDLGAHSSSQSFTARTEILAATEKSHSTTVTPQTARLVPFSRRMSASAASSLPGGTTYATYQNVINELRDRGNINTGFTVTPKSPWPQKPPAKHDHSSTPPPHLITDEANLYRHPQQRSGSGRTRRSKDAEEDSFENESLAVGIGTDKTSAPSARRHNTVPSSKEGFASQHRKSFSDTDSMAVEVGLGTKKKLAYDKLDNGSNSRGEAVARDRKRKSFSDNDSMTVEVGLDSDLLCYNATKRANATMLSMDTFAESLTHLMLNKLTSSSAKRQTAVDNLDKHLAYGFLPLSAAGYEPDAEYIQTHLPYAAHEDKEPRNIGSVQENKRMPKRVGTSLDNVSTGDDKGHLPQITPVWDTSHRDTTTSDEGTRGSVRSHSSNKTPSNIASESYQRTYRALSPVLSLGLSPHMSDDGHGITGTPLSPPLSLPSPQLRQRARRARFHDPGDDAKSITKALWSDPPNIDPLLLVLPSLTHEQVLEMRAEYKSVTRASGKAGGEYQSVNVANHIRTRLKDCADVPLRTACYVTALGCWESEAYWVNYWCQSDMTRPEMLIDALCSRSNREVSEIVAAFKDQQYGNNIVHCLQDKLRNDKFKQCVMVCLEAKRDEDDIETEDGAIIPVVVDDAKVHKDVADIVRALEKDSEGPIMKVVLKRSYRHLTAVLRRYRVTYGGNLAKRIVAQSGNPAGDVLAHILNGAINRSVRDAMLVHQAIQMLKFENTWHEMLTSRLVRLHWDRDHLERVKLSYKKRFDTNMRDAVREATGSSDWGHFCQQLCISRTDGGVKIFTTDTESRTED